MSNLKYCPNTLKEPLRWLRLGQTLTLLVASCGTAGCAPIDDTELTPYAFRCGTDPSISLYKNRDDHSCGFGDENLPAEPSYDNIAVCETIEANKSTPDETNLDTKRVQDALNNCKGAGKGAVKLVANGSNNAFITGHLVVHSTILWVDDRVTLYASRNPAEYQGPLNNCGVPGINDSSACQDFISVDYDSPGVVGDGTIDGQGGEPLVDVMSDGRVVERDYSWWELSGALREINGSAGNPTLINVLARTTKFLLYRIKLVDSPKFHVKISSAPIRGVANPACDVPGDGFTVWGVIIQTPSKWMNSQGRLMSPQYSRNTDGIDPGANSVSSCGVIACSTITTGDDHIAIKGGHHVSNLVIAHNQFGTGHGMSIGSETMGDAVDDTTKERLPAIDNVKVYDLTIDADSRWVGEDASPNDFNGIRIKSDPSRGGEVTNVSYSDVCMRDMYNSILISTSYNPLFSGIPKYMPKFGKIDLQNIRGVTCMAQTQTVVSISGYNVNNITGPVTLDNVHLDNIGPQSTYTRFADVVMGPGPVNFDMEGFGSTVTRLESDGRAKKRCRFPELPAPKKPEGWVW